MREPASVIVSHRFARELRSAQEDIRKKVVRRVRLIEEHGPRYPSLECRRVQANPDPRYHYIDVDDGYRMVVYVDAQSVLLEKLGPHDPTLRWGERASVGPYRHRASVSASNLADLAVWSETASEPSMAEQRSEPISLPALASAHGNADIMTEGGADFLEGYVDGTIEDWMVFLSPLQRSIARRPTDGPMRIRGGPGTGKTVVALHRAIYLAEQFGPGCRILVSSYVRTMPTILENLANRLPGFHADRIDFHHIVELARDLMNARGYRIDNEKARSIFTDTWVRDATTSSRLYARGFGQDYVWDEIGKVVLGRVARSKSDYLGLERHGRHKAMSPEDRELVWHLLMQYSIRCQKADPPVRDQDSLVHQAAKAKIEPIYDAIIVDEGQDLTQAGLEMLLGLLRGGPNGTLLIVGDASQRIYPGGYRLSDSHVDIRGRSVILRHAYRSSSGIVEAIGKVGSALSAADFGDDGLGSLGLQAVRSGPGPTVTAYADDEEELIETMSRIYALTQDDRTGVAVLLPSNASAREWRRHAKEYAIRSNLLETYEGLPRPGVEFGTYARAKGLEFSAVFLPQLSDDRFPSVSLEEIDEFILQGSWLYVAMSRARDGLHMSYVGKPSYLIEPLLSKELSR